MRCIDADDIVYESIDSSDTCRHESYYGTGILAVRKEDIDAMPTIEPERKTGKWIPLQLSMAHPPYQCSCCFKNAPMVETGCLVNRYLEALLTDYCPNCGSFNGGNDEE